MNVLSVQKVLLNVKSVVHIVNSSLKSWKKCFVIHTLYIYIYLFIYLLKMHNMRYVVSYLMSQFSVMCVKRSVLKWKHVSENKLLI